MLLLDYNAAIERERKLEATIISHKEMKEKTENMVKKLRTTFPIAGRDQQVATMIKVLKKHIKDTNKGSVAVWLEEIHVFRI